MNSKFLFAFFLVFNISLAIPLPVREFNEDNYSKFLNKNVSPPPRDPKRENAEDWARFVDEDQQKADEMFGNNRKSSTAMVEPQQLPEGDPIEHADPDHLEGLPIEGDGKLNIEFKSELFLGLDHDHGQGTPEEQRELIKKTFNNIDKNGDGVASVEELTDWFLLNIRRHMGAAQNEGEGEFKRIDVNKDHKLQWSEYESAHLRAALASAAKETIVPAHKSSAKVNVAHGENEEHGHVRGENHEDHLAALRMRWMRADENGDDELSLSEFQAFHHPEQHPEQLESLAKQLMQSFDLDDDGKIAEWEFEAHTDRLPEEVRAKGPGAVMQYTNEIVAERKHQFQLADVDGDGFLTFEEVSAFMDPQNTQHAKHEAEDIVNIADVDGDKQLSLEEMLEKADELLGPTRRLCDPSETLHDMDEL